MRKRSFVPSVVNPLEDRIAPSGVHFIHGAAVLTTHAYSKTQSEISRAFKTFATKGQNYNRLSHDLSKAVARIPYNMRDGLQDSMKFEVDNLQADIDGGASTPVINARANSLADLKDFVQSEVDAGVIVIRR